MVDSGGGNNLELQDPELGDALALPRGGQVEALDVANDLGEQGLREFLVDARCDGRGRADVGIREAQGYETNRDVWIRCEVERKSVQRGRRVEFPVGAGGVRGELTGSALDRKGNKVWEG